MVAPFVRNGVVDGVVFRIESEHRAMAIPGLVVFAIVFNLAVLSLAVAGLYLVFWRGEGRRSPDEWRTHATALARRLNGVLADRDPPHDAEDVARSVLPLVGQFEHLARSAPPAVDASLAARLHRLGVACRRLGIEYPHRSPGREDYDALVSEVAARAERVARDIEAAGTDVRA